MQIDTHEIYKKLITAGFSDQQAKGLVYIIIEMIESYLPPKKP